MAEKKITINILNQNSNDQNQYVVFQKPIQNRDLFPLAWYTNTPEMRAPDSKQFNWHIDPVLTYPTEPKKLDQDLPAFKDGKFVFQLPLSAIKPESE